MPESTQWMIYGANGYTGQLVAELAKSRGAAPILAGRAIEKLRPLGERLGLEVRAFPLEPAACEKNLAGMGAVLHCAGPFSQTSKAMVDACLAAGAHYLDVTGELKVIEAVLSRGAEAKARGVALLPAVGFDVVPSDCLALSLKEKLPTATSLELAFATKGRSSPGTMKTAIESLPEGGFVRRGGKLVRVAPAHEVREIEFHDGKKRCMSIPWGDLASAWVSTGIPDITVYLAAPESMIRGARLSRFLMPALKLGAVQRFLQRRVEKSVKGPDEAMRARLKVEFWGRVRDDNGASVEATLTVPEGYTLTAEAALTCTLRALKGDVPPGAFTPSQAFGSRFITELTGTTLRI
jgi:short subunit dehydrogenase-like uncharacterized protein